MPIARAFRALVVGLPFFLAALSQAQTPEVAIFAELTPTWSANAGQTNLLRWYDAQGRYSVIGMHMVLETGNILKVTQRLEKIDNGGDPDSLDEAYIESRGTWRIGKQYLPFGTQNMMRETVPALRYDTILVIAALPIKIAVSDNGVGLTRGVAARVGDSVGVSYAVGDHFAIQGTSLTQIRRPENAPGNGRGYDRAWGVDLSRRWAGGTLEFEWVSLRNGATPTDLEMDISDLRFRFLTPVSNLPLALSWVREWETHNDWYSLSGDIAISRSLVWQPFVRFNGLDWQDFALSAKLRL